MIQRKSLAGRAQSSGSGGSSSANPTATETMNKRADLYEQYKTFPGKQEATMEELDIELQTVQKDEIKNVLNANSAIKRKDETKQTKGNSDQRLGKRNQTKSTSNNWRVTQ